MLGVRHTSAGARPGSRRSPSAPAAVRCARHPRTGRFDHQETDWRRSHGDRLRWLHAPARGWLAMKKLAKWAYPGSSVNCARTLSQSKRSAGGAACEASGRHQCRRHQCAGGKCSGRGQERRRLKDMAAHLQAGPVQPSKGQRRVRRERTPVKNFPGIAARPARLSRSVPARVDCRAHGRTCASCLFRRVRAGCGIDSELSYSAHR